MSQIPSDQGVYQIAVASQLLGLSARTLRLYEQEGLIRPDRNPQGSQRFFSQQDLTWVRCIQELIHEHSLTTVSIRRLLDLIPCWEIKHCSAEVAEKCRPALRIPGMASGASSPAAPAADSAKDDEGGGVEMTLFYGVKQFGVIFPCTRCIQAERILRRLAEKYQGKLVIRKHDVLSQEADQAGVMLTPTILLAGKTIACGKALSERKLEELLKQHLETTPADADLQTNDL